MLLLLLLSGSRPNTRHGTGRRKGKGESGLRCAPKLYAPCTYPLWQIVCLSDNWQAQSVRSPPHQLHRLLPLCDCRLRSVYICAERGKNKHSQKQRQRQRHSHTEPGYSARRVCMCINISLPYSPSETPKFCNIYKVAKKTESNRIEAQRI